MKEAFIALTAVFGTLGVMLVFLIGVGMGAEYGAKKETEENTEEEE